jgi:hypothetical protein
MTLGLPKMTDRMSTEVSTQVSTEVRLSTLALRKRFIKLAKNLNNFSMSTVDTGLSVDTSVDTIDGRFPPILSTVHPVHSSFSLKTKEEKRIGGESVWSDTRWNRGHTAIGST